MKKRENIRFINSTLCALILLAGSTAAYATSGVADVQGASNKASSLPATDLTAVADESAAAYSYRIEGRPDPFSPFISEKAASNLNMDEIVDSNETLTGMQLFEPSQLKLVAVVFEDKVELAMVEDATGQGYSIRIGTKIGKNGVVTTINPNQVVIEETSVTRAGKKLTNNIVMLLKKEGEE